MPDFKMTSERAGHDKTEHDKKPQVSASQFAGPDLPQPRFIAVPGLHGALPPLRRLRAADPLGGGEVPEPVVGELRRRGGRGAALESDVSGPLEHHFGMDLSAVRYTPTLEPGGSPARCKRRHSPTATTSTSPRVRISLGPPAASGCWRTR